MLIKGTTIFLLLSIVFNEGHEWLKQLEKNIENEAKSVNQIIILHSSNENASKWRIEEMLCAMLAKFPNRHINFQSESVENQISKLSIADPKTVLFVLIHYENGDQDSSQLSKPINFVSNVSDARSRPKCLIICFENSNSFKYGKLLRRMWSHDFLDAMAFSILLENSTSLLKNDHQLTLTIYYYNPHTNVMTKVKKQNFQLFPDKTLNLKQYPLNVMFQNYPPEIFLPTKPWEKTEVSGIAWLKIKALSEAMNFKIIVKLNKGLSNLDCKNKYNSTGIYYALINRDIEFFGMEFRRFVGCDEGFYEWALGILEIKAVLVVPILSNESTIMSDKWAIVRLFSMISFPFIIWLCVHFSRIHSPHLQLMFLIQITLGWTVPRVPEKPKERIIFGGMLIACTLCSSMIYMALTDVGMHKETNYALESIDDVLSSNISILVNINIAQLLENVVSNKSALVLQKALKVNDGTPYLTKQVYITRNVSSIAFSMYAKFLIQEERDRCDMPIAKILEDDYLVQTISATVMASRSPYVRRVNVLLQRLIQSGITDKWKHSYVQKPSMNAVMDFTCYNRSMELQQILWKLFFIIIIGFSLSIVTFLMEVFVSNKYIVAIFKKL